MESGPSNPKQTELIYRPVVDLADSIRSGKITSETVVTAFLNRAKEVNPVIGAIVEWNDRAIEEARELDNYFLKNGKTMGPLHGIPFTIKEHIGVKGFHCTGGIYQEKENIAQEDATVVRRLKEAGGILLGTTNLPEHSFTYNGNNNIYPPTLNPYNLKHSPGGSSSGEAAIIAAGGSPFGIGSDIAGSARVPAAWCGTNSILPTKGRLPVTNTWPSIDATVVLGYTQSFYHLGPLAKYPQDLDLILRTISGPDGYDWQSYIPPYNAFMGDVDVGTLRVGYFFEDDSGYSVIEDVRDSILTVAETLRKKVKVVEEVKAPYSWKEASTHFYTSLFLDRLKLMKLKGSPDFQFIDEISKTILFMKNYDHNIDTISTTPIYLNMLRRDFLKKFENYDVLIMPVSDMPAESLEKSYSTPEYFFKMRWSQIINGVGTPSVIAGPVAVGRSGSDYDGLPIGVQVVVPPFMEHVALSVAGYIHQNIPIATKLHPDLEKLLGSK